MVRPDYHITEITLHWSVSIWTIFSTFFSSENFTLKGQLDFATSDAVFPLPDEMINATFQLVKPQNQKQLLVKSPLIIWATMLSHIFLK